MVLVEFDEGPASIGPKLVHAGNPVSLHRRFLRVRVDVPVALHLHDQVERIVGAVPVVHENDEVGPVHLLLVPNHVGNLEAEIEVLRVGERAGMRLHDAAEDLLPPRIADGVVDMRLSRVRLVGDLLRPRDAEVDGGRRTGRQEVVQLHGDRRRVLLGRLADNGVVHAVAGLVAQVRVVHHHVLGDVRAAQITLVHPVREQSLDLCKEVDAVHRGGRPVEPFQETPREQHDDVGPATSAPLVCHHRLLADRPGIEDHGRPRLALGDLQHGGVREVRPQLHPGPDLLQVIAEHARKADFQGIPFRADGMDVDHVRRRDRRRVLHAGSEVERDAEDIGILGIIESRILVGLVVETAQASPDDLLAQELRAKRAHAKDVRDRVRVPAFRQHRHGHHAADRLAQPPRLSDRVHHLAENRLLAQLLRLGVLAPGDHLALEHLDLRGGRLAEVVGQGFARLQLGRVD